MFCAQKVYRNNNKNRIKNYTCDVSCDYFGSAHSLGDHKCKYIQVFKSSFYLITCSCSVLLTREKLINVVKRL